VQRSSSAADNRYVVVKDSLLFFPLLTR